MFEPIDHLDYFRGVGLAPAGPPPRGVTFCCQRSLLQHVMAEATAAGLVRLYDAAGDVLAAAD